MTVTSVDSGSAASRGRQAAGADRLAGDSADAAVRRGCLTAAGGLPADTVHRPGVGDAAEAAEQEEDHWAEVGGAATECEGKLCWNPWVL